MKIRRLLLLSTLLLAGSGAVAEQAPRPAGQLRTVQYAPDDTDFPNPERGFSLPNGTPAQARAADMSLMHAYFRLDPFKARPLSKPFLAEVEQRFAAARLGGVKLVPRFIYNFPKGLPLQPGDEDAALPVVLGHIAQLEPILKRNSDVIAFMEAGFVGAWGEWHHSTNGLTSPGAKAAILKRLLRALPPERFVALRYQRDKIGIFGRTAPVTAAEAAAASDIGRVGHHNDCFLASPDDWDTYGKGGSRSIETQKAYLSEENRHVPQGGETCNAAADAQPFIPCPNALTELERLRWSQLNARYHPEVLRLWREQGCYADIAKRLGYRLRLVSAAFPTAVARGSELKATLMLRNDGFAAPYNRRPAELVLRSPNSGQEHTLPLEVDPRDWDGGETRTIPLRIAVPRSLSRGTYDLLLKLPDASPRLRRRPEYSIRLANAGIWEPATGANKLGLRLQVH